MRIEHIILWYYNNFKYLHKIMILKKNNNYMFLLVTCHLYNKSNIKKYEIK